MRAFLTAVTLIVFSGAVAAAQPQAPLRIVVLEGEGAVNIVQQKTAVRPLVEVRDRNNVPVAGASVTFTIGGGGQGAVFAGGAQTVTVTTNAAGQAAASGFSAVSSGAVQIQVQAVYHGQIATAAISQTNFATAAAAAQAGAGAGGGSAAGGTAGAGGAGGGGMSATTIGIIGGAVAGGAVAATQLTRQQDTDFVDSYSGQVTGQIIVSSTFAPAIGPPTNCAFTKSITGTVRIDLESAGTGEAVLRLRVQGLSVTGNCILDTTAYPVETQALPVTGGPSAITFTYTYADAVASDTWRFNGSLSGNTITGTLTHQVAPPAGANPRYSGSTTMTVTLTGARP